ncbi:DUF2157 domain-containing protein [Skermanella mucosa]|uniref:DUF2157 domain-containing protein n=1 Tax=Skermanella mucosa TaxID=1789672 RepID=UPI00192C3834|nr:DUF2157 domain-containing protein [Skermanella mucosa]UEM21599.1 DUF2157 domain-containing protein [Skermanella mucosa]
MRHHLAEFYYIERLREDLPRWVERGWIRPEDAEAALADAKAARLRRIALPNLLALFGTILVAVGAFLFIAANWQGMGRLAKLAVLFGSLWGTHAAAWAALRAGMGRFAEALLLFGVLLFGVGIMLVGQIYHLPADPPAGVLMWALGAILAAWAWPSEWAACAALALVTVWFSLAAPDSPLPVFLPFIPVWAALLPPILRMRWIIGYHAALASLAWFILVTLASLFSTADAAEGDVLRLGSAISAALLAVGGVLSGRPLTAEFGTPLERLALMGLVVGASLLALPALQTDLSAIGEPAWAGLALPPLLVAAAGAAVVWRRDGGLLAGGAAALAAILLADALVPPESHGISLILLNLVLVGALIGMIAEGYRREDRFTVNLGFLAFALTLLRLYFDTFWLLLDRALFFIFGGLLVMALGWLFERKRRLLVGGGGSKRSAAA